MVILIILNRNLPQQQLTPTSNHLSLSLHLHQLPSRLCGSLLMVILRISFLWKQQPIISTLVFASFPNLIYSCTGSHLHNMLFLGLWLQLTPNGILPAPPHVMGYTCVSCKWLLDTFKLTEIYHLISFHMSRNAVITVRMVNPTATLMGCCMVMYSL